MKKNFAITLATGMALVYSVGYASAKGNEVGKRTDALDNSVWNHSEWISVADAPVVNGAIHGDNERAADGASWFMSTIKNDKNTHNLFYGVGLHIRSIGTGDSKG